MQHVLALVAILGLGCAGLIVEPYDSAGKKTAKVATRVVLGVATLSISEIYISDAKSERDRAAERQLQYAERQRQKAERQRQEGLYLNQIARQMEEAKRQALTAKTQSEREFWLQRHAQLFQQQQDYYEAKRQADAARRQAAMQFLLNSMNRPPPSLERRQPVKCTSAIFGNVVQTTCN